MTQRRSVAHSSHKTAHHSDLKTEKLGPESAYRSEVDVRRLLRADVNTPNIRPGTIDRSTEDVKRLPHTRAAEHGPPLTVGSSAFFVILLGIVVIGGIAAIMWLRDLATTFGVNWH